MEAEEHGPAVWQCHLGTGDAQFSPGIPTLLGCSIEELGNDLRALSRWLTPEAAQRQDDAIATLLASSDDQCGCDLTLRRADGTLLSVQETIFLVRDGDNPSLLLGVLRGGADAGSDESALTRFEHSQRLFRTFVDALPQLAWTADADGWISFYNQRWYEYTGTTPAQMEGWGWIRVHDPNDLPRMLRIWRNALESGEPWEDEFRLRRGSDGMLRWHLSRAMPVRDEAGRIIRWFGTNTDVHDQKLAAEEYARLLTREEHARREAEAANRAKDEFLAVVSHELRTPLNAILGWSQMLARVTADPEKLARGLEKIEENARRQAKLIEDLLDMSRVTTGKLELQMEPVGLGKVVHRVVESNRPAADAKRIRITYSDASEDAVIRGSVARLEQIVENLFSNAVKFTPAGGRIEVELSRVANAVELRVTDTGQGIAADFLPYVFDRFRQADASSTRVHAGLGLGLAIVRELVHLHGGEVGVDSEGSGRGATFTVRMPLLRDSAGVDVCAATEKAAAAPEILTGIKVLAVDDEPSAREVLAEMLLTCGASVTVASSVQEALRMFKLSAPDVVVTDIAMPEQDGYVLVEKIRALGGSPGSTPIVALTAYASIQDRDHALSRGFDRWLAKPIDARRLSTVVAEVAREGLMHDPE